MNFTRAFKSAIINLGDSLSVNLNAQATFQITRSFFAFATLTTLLFSASDVLFSQGFLNSIDIGIPVYKITLFKVLGYPNLWIGKLISIGCLLFVISGYYPKASSILHWYISFSFCANTMNVDGGDQIASVITLLLIPMAFCDPRKNAWHKIEQKSRYSNFLSNIFLVLIQMQIAIIYLYSGIAKLNVPEWLNGTAYYYWFADKSLGAPHYLTSIIGNPFSNAFLVATVTWGTIILEVLLAACFFSKNVFFRKAMFRIGIAFHFMTFFIHGIFTFFIVMAGCLIIYLKSDN